MQELTSPTYADVVKAEPLSADELPNDPDALRRRARRSLAAKDADTTENRRKWSKISRHETRHEAARLAALGRVTEQRQQARSAAWYQAFGNGEWVAKAGSSPARWEPSQSSQFPCFKQNSERLSQQMSPPPDQAAEACEPTSPAATEAASEPTELPPATEVATIESAGGGGSPEPTAPTLMPMEVPTQLPMPEKPAAEAAEAAGHRTQPPGLPPPGLPLPAGSPDTATAVINNINYI
jgi:hypothetical protein